MAIPKQLTKLEQNTTSVLSVAEFKNMATREEIAYLAGIIDGEGTIIITKQGTIKKRDVYSK